MLSPLRKACVVGAVWGVVVGVLMVVWGGQTAMAQEAAPVVAVAASSEVDLLVRLLGMGGLPAVLGWLGWWVPHKGSQLIDNVVKSTVTELQKWEPTVTIKMADDEDTQIILLRQRIADLEASKVSAR